MTSSNKPSEDPINPEAEGTDSEPKPNGSEAPATKPAAPAKPTLASYIKSSQTNNNKFKGAGSFNHAKNGSKGFTSIISRKASKGR
jgi:hypothetical protein